MNQCLHNPNIIGDYQILNILNYGKHGLSYHVIDTNINKEFVNKIILKKMEAEMKKYISMNEALNYGDRNVDLYRNFDSFKNKLLVTSSITPEIEVQVGKDIYPYLNKILKTELDKTLQNSLNSLIINF